MRITVTRVSEPPGGRSAPVVEFGCAAGTAVASWAGAVRPEPGDHHVELDVPEPVSEFERVEPGLEGVEGARNDPGGNHLSAVRLCGRVEQVGAGADPVVVLRIGGGLLQVEASGPRPLPGEWVRFTATELVLYPKNL